MMKREDFKKDLACSLRNSIRLARKARKLSFEDLAALAGLSEIQVACCERRAMHTPVCDLANLAESLGPGVQSKVFRLLQSGLGERYKETRRQMYRDQVIALREQNIFPIREMVEDEIEQSTLIADLFTQREINEFHLRTKAKVLSFEIPNPSPDGP